MIRKLLIAAAMMFSLTPVIVPATVGALTPVMVPATVGALDLKSQACKGANLDSADSTCKGDGGFKDTFKKIVNAFIFLVGAVSVLVIIIGGFRFAVSGGGDAAKSARGMVLFAVVGLAISFLAYAIVNFVLERLGV